MLSLKQVGSSNVSKPNVKYSRKSSFIYRKARIMSLSFVIAMLSFSLAGCATLQALEPTADLITDLKKIL